MEVCQGKAILKVTLKSKHMDMPPRGIKGTQKVDLGPRHNISNLVSEIKNLEEECESRD